MSPRSRPRLFTNALYASTIFLSSFLLFLIQPVSAKLILPWFGGSAAVWTTCLVFFQGALVAGYGYSYFIVKHPRPIRQALVHGVLLAAAIAMLPAAREALLKPVPDVALHPAARILAILTEAIGLPYVLLSSTAPLLQAWYARTSRSPSTQPYRLYALSNAGALLALVAYPSLIEPRWTTHSQDRLWSIGFVIFAALCAASSAIAARTRPTSSDVPDDVSQNAAAPAENVPAVRRFEWIALAAAGSMLLLAITNQLTQNVAPVPLLWIAPLTVYLLTFILCFGSTRWYRREVVFRFLAVALAGVAYSIYDIQLSDAIVVSIPIFLLGLFVGCVFCHGELNRRRPPASQLTSFYLMIAAGGALGAVLVGLIAPAIFSGVYELPVALTVVAALALWINLRESAAWSARLLWAAVTVAMIAVCAAQVRGYHQGAVELVRSFYGSLRVVDSDGVRKLFHGTVEHGSQFLAPQKRRSPTTYYGYSSGVGLALQFFDRHGRAQDSASNGTLRVGVIGLGAGTLSAYGRAGDQFHFYEINPQVIGIARDKFSYIRDSQAQIGITSGDARLSLEAEEAQGFDMLIVDAFSGDAIPVHLLTKEAFALYFRHLKPEGALALHVSNQYVDLAAVAGGLAAAFGRPAIEIQSPKDAAREILAADWILISANRDLLANPEIQRAGEPAPVRPGLRVWTDDYNNLLQVMRWLPTS